MTRVAAGQVPFRQTMKLPLQTLGLFPKCAFGEKSDHGHVGMLEEVRKLAGCEGTNHEFPARDELGMGSEFERNSRRNVGDRSLDGGRIKEMHDVRVLFIESESPRSL